MFCIYCGVSNPEEASFCPGCGKAVVRAPAEFAPQAPPLPNVAPPAPAAAQAAVSASTTAPNIKSAALMGKPRILSGHTLPIYSLAFSPDGRRLASGSIDKTSKIWDLAEDREVRTFTGNFAVTCVAFSHDERQFVIGATNGPPLNSDEPAGNSITLWDCVSPGQVRSLAGHPGQLFCVQFSPDGRFLVSTDGAAVTNLWDISTGKIIKTFKYGWLRSKFLGGTVGTSLAFSPDGSLLATRSSPATLWDISTGKEVRAFGPEPHSGFVTMFLKFTPDGQSLIQCRGNGTIKVWDVDSGKELGCLADPPARSGVTERLRCAALSADGNLLAVSTYSSAEKPSDRVTLLDISAGRAVEVVGGDTCNALAFSPDGQWLAIADMAYGDGKALGKIKLLRISEMK